jgi:predicted Fe-Mo cluster-binding NifX family protein
MRKKFNPDYRSAICPAIRGAICVMVCAVVCSMIGLAAAAAFSVGGAEVMAAQSKDIDRNLLEAVQDGDIGQVQALIEKGADVNAMDEDGMTALAWAVQLDDRGMAELLIAKGADVEKGGKAFKAPLHVAANWGKMAMAELLLSKGADIEVRDRNGWTPLHWAAFEGGGEMVQLLVSRGAEKNARTEKKWSVFGDGWTALDIAERAGDAAVAGLLRRLGCRRGKEQEGGPWVYAGFSFDTEPDEVGWLRYLKPAELKREEVKEAAADEFPLNREMPEAVVLYFYAHFMRGDTEACREVLYPGGGTEEELKDMEKWTIRKVRLLKIKKYSLSQVEILLHLEVEVDGEIEKGEDEISLLFETNQWWITNLPL